MSAENDLTAFRMENGEIWIVNRACGDTVAESQGRCYPVAKCKTYEEARVTFARMCDEESDTYVYTEYGGRLPPLSELREQPPRFLSSTITVSFANRRCGCVDYRDLRARRWKVLEHGSHFGEEKPRMIGVGLWYAEAITLAHTYGVAQPGECRVEVPQVFRSFWHYPRHECHSDHFQLCIPRQGR